MHCEIVEPKVSPMVNVGEANGEWSGEIGTFVEE